MGRYTEKRKRETDQGDSPGRHPAASASRFRPTGEGGRTQPVNGSTIWENTSYVASVGRGDQFGQGKLPPFSTFFNKTLLSEEASPERRRRSHGGVRSETVTSGSSCPAASSQVGAMKLPPSCGEQIVSIQVTEGLDVPQTGAAGRPLNPDPVPVPSSRLGGGSAAISFTIPPTEDDVKQMLSVQDKNGYIKRPLNAFMVWSCIHRHALRKACQETSMISTSVLLGSEWSKLSDQQKRPYYEAAQRLKDMHKQQFPDYEFRPQRKKGRECLPSEQGAEEDPGVTSFVSQAIFPAQSMLSVPSMYSCPTVMSCGVGYNPYPSFCPFHATGLYSSIQGHFSRHFYSLSNASSSMVEVRNYQSTHLLQNEMALTTEHHPAGVEVLIGSTTTSVNL